MQKRIVNMINVTYDARRWHHWLFFICLALVFTLAWPWGNAQAQSSLTVTATVHSPAPTQPALITSHQDGQHIKESNTLIQGTCSNDTAFVELWRNSSFVGTTMCMSGIFEIPLSFLPGPNVLYTKVLSSTGNPGPISPSITVFYDIETPVIPEIITILPLLPPVVGPPCNAQSSPLSLALDPSFQESSTGIALKWTLETIKGCEPYKLSIDWGDGVTTVEEILSGVHDIHHTFYRPGQYLIRFYVTDASGQQTSIQSITVIKGKTIDIPPTIDDVSSWVVPTITVAALTATTATFLIFGRRVIVRAIRWISKK